MRLADFIDINPPVAMVKGKTYPCVMMEEVEPNRRYVHGFDTKKFGGGGAKFQDGDTLFARITPSLENGKIAQYIGKKTPTGFGSTEFIVFRAKEGVSDPGFVFYLAKTEIVRKPAEKSMFGASGRQRADVNVIKEIEIPIYSLPIQRKIATILTAYDDLIENNTCRIKILEEMAQTIYREWFVQYHFPGYKDIHLIDTNTEYGKIPEGWEIVPFTDFIDVLSGGTPKTSVSEYWDGDIPWFTPQDLTNSFYALDTTRKITDLGLSKCSSKLYPRNTVFITARGTVGKCILASVPMAMSQTNYALITRNGYSQYFLYLLTLNCVNRLKQQATGAVFDTIIVDTFRKLIVVKPSSSIVEVFHTIVSSVFDDIENLQKKNVNLRQQRDLLLPKLISSELDVSELNIQME